MGRFKKLFTAGAAARNQASKHPGPVHRGIDKVADFVRGHAPDQHAEKVDRGSSMAKKALTGRDRLAEEQRADEAGPGRQPAGELDGEGSTGAEATEESEPTEADR